METRINNYLRTYTPTCLSLLIVKAQASGGIRSFHCPEHGKFGAAGTGTEYVTEMLDDNELYVIDEHNWDFDHFGTAYRYLIDYDTGDVHVSSKY
jgi:hypothetical protein